MAGKRGMVWKRDREVQTNVSVVLGADTLEFVNKIAAERKWSRSMTIDELLRKMKEEKIGY